MRKRLSGAARQPNYSVKRCLKALDSSSNVLLKSQHGFGDLQGVLQTSKTLIRKLNQRDRIDKYLIFFGFVVFLLVVVYIVKKRIWLPF